MTIVRLELSDGDATPRPCVAKLASQGEVTALRLVHEALPQIAPKFLQAVPLGDGDALTSRYWLLMEDCCAGSGATTLSRLFVRRGGRPKARAAVQTAIGHLAALHRHFESKISDLQASGIRPALTRRTPAMHDIEEVCDRARRLSAHRGDEDFNVRCAALSRRMADFFEQLKDPQQHTLVHGDFHFDNVVITRTGRPVIVDWGSAATANPCWDLVFCGAAELAAYLSATNRRPRPERRDFLENHRAAVAVRMFCLLERALAIGRDRASDQVRSAVQIIVRNMVRAERRPYWGGLGFQTGYGAGNRTIRISPDRRP